MSWTLPPEGLNLLLAGLQEVQLALRALLHAIGLAPELHGQPAWPFAHRLAGEMLALDAGHARRVVGTLGCGLVAVGLLGLSLAWRRRRAVLWGLALLTVLLAPWPEARVLWAPAVPTSLHTSPTGFPAQGIVRGQAVYQQFCVSCHGADGRGEGPRAASLPMWPPTLNGALLWKRLDGELFWRVRHGMSARDGSVTMPGFERLSDAQIWDVLDFLQANAAGQTLKASGAWAHPVRLPDAPVQCRNGGRPSVRSLAGQRLRVALAGPDTGLADDPRLTTLQVRVPSRAAAGSDPECRTDAPEAATALALVLGVPPDQLTAQQLLVDRGGWLRARSQPGQAGWSEDDLVCTTSSAARPGPAKAPAADGLDALIRRMDAEPVRLLRGGFPHAGRASG